MNTTKEKEMKMLFGYMQENTFFVAVQNESGEANMRCGRHMLWNGKFPIKISCSFFFWLIPTTSILVSKKWC